MGRARRIVEPGLSHHVMSRGPTGQRIFVTDEDRQSFLLLLSLITKRWGVRILAFCLMETHYHLLICDELGCLSEALRDLNGIYAQRFNRRHGRDGALFRGRFRSRVVQDQTYLFEVARYIHMNPVKAGMVATASEHPWSSHRVALSGERVPWLDVDGLLTSFGGRTLDGRLAFDAFVHERAGSEVRRRVEEARWTALLGDDEFVAEWEERLRLEVAVDPGDAGAGRLTHLDPEQVLAAASEVCDVPREALSRGVRGRHDLHRSLAILALRDHGGATGADLARLFGLGLSGVSMQLKRTRMLVQADGQAKLAWERLRSRLGAPSVAPVCA